MNDFIFGTLATDELRVQHEQARRRGVTHATARKPRDPGPGQSITLDLTVGPDYACDHAWVYWTDNGSDPAGDHGTAVNGQAAQMEAVGVEWDTLTWGYIKRYRLVLPGQAEGCVLRYRLSVQAGEQETFADAGTYFACYVADDPAPDWIRRAVVYQIFVDRFYPGRSSVWQRPDSLSGIFGGTLRGISDKMGYLADLGVNVLWLTPTFPSPSHHGYDATDLFEIEPRLGSKADLQQLCQEAHARGMRVLLDFVPNHWSNLHVTFQDAVSNPHSPYRDWYTFQHYPDEYETFFGVKSLPQLNLRNPGARQHLLDAARHWFDYGIDGYRVDYAIGPTHDFWADFRRAVYTANPDAWTFGEVVEPPESQLRFEGQLDGCLDFNLLEAFRQAFGWGLWDARRFADFLTRHEAFFPPSFSRPSFLDNHDMNRFLWITQGDRRRLKLAALCQFALAGPPVIYYGTEVGLSQERDVRQDNFGIMEEARLPMTWDERQDLDLHAFYKHLIQLRSAQDSLSSGKRRILYVDPHVLAFAQEGDTPGVAAVLNLSTDPQQVTLEGDWQDVLLATDPACDVKTSAGQVCINLPPLGGVYLK